MRLFFVRYSLINITHIVSLFALKKLKLNTNDKILCVNDTCWSAQLKTYIPHEFFRFSIKGLRWR